MAKIKTQGAAEGGPGAGAGPGPANQQGPARGRIVMLNALPLNALPRSHLRLDILPVNIVELGHWLHKRLAEGYRLVHFIRHEATLRALRRELGIPLPLEPNSGLYQYQNGDVLVVVTLRNPPRGQEVAQVNVSDLEIWIVTVL